MSTLKSKYANVKKLLALAFIAAIVINIVLAYVLVSVFGDHKELIFNLYGGVTVAITIFCIWVAFREKRSLFWPYLAINMNASAALVGILYLVFYPPNWAIMLLLVITAFILLGLNVGNLKDPQAPAPKVPYVIYQLLSAVIVLLNHWLILPK